VIDSEAVRRRVAQGPREREVSGDEFLTGKSSEPEERVSAAAQEVLERSAAPVRLFRVAVTRDDGSARVDVVLPGELDAFEDGLLEDLTAQHWVVDERLAEVSA